MKNTVLVSSNWQVSQENLSYIPILINFELKNSLPTAGKVRTVELHTTLNIITSRGSL